MDLANNPVALVTGGEGDLASAIATALSEAGMSVRAPGRGDLDVSDSDSIREFFAGFKRLDFLVNNAGMTRDRSLIQMTEADWDDLMAVNLRGAFLCARAALKLMIRQRSGHIVNVGSFSAFCPPGGQSGYAASKAGLIGLTQALADEAGKRGVRVNCVLPGFLETKMTRELAPERIEAVRGSHALGRFNTPAEAAKFIAFLDSMSAVSGQVFQLDSRLRKWV